MTDTEKLRTVADVIRSRDTLANEQDAEELAAMVERIADLLDVVPSETITALRAGTWKAVPVELTERMMEACWELGSHSSPSGVRSHWYSFLNAAPEKPD